MLAIDKRKEITPAEQASYQRCLLGAPDSIRKPIRFIVFLHIPALCLCFQFNSEQPHSKLPSKKLDENRSQPSLFRIRKLLLTAQNRPYPPDPSYDANHSAQYRLVPFIGEPNHRTATICEQRNSATQVNQGENNSSDNRAAPCALDDDAGDCGIRHNNQKRNAILASIHKYRAAMVPTILYNDLPPRSR